METLIEYTVAIAFTLAIIAAPFAMGFAFSALVPGMGGVGIMAGFGFIPVLLSLMEKVGV